MGKKKKAAAAVAVTTAAVAGMVTGNGLKDVANAIKACGEPITIPSDMDLLLKAFDDKGIVVE